MKKQEKPVQKSRRGGKRPGAGRPKGGGKYGCPTKAVRVPVHLVDEVREFVLRKTKADHMEEGDA